MVQVDIAERLVEIPEGVSVDITNNRIRVAGPKGKLEEDLSHIRCAFELERGGVRVTSRWPRKADIAMVGTATARIRNMIKGVSNGFTFKMKVVHAHFPVTIKVVEKEKKILIENFTGEKTAREVRVVGDARVKASGDEVVIQGIKLEDVSQTAANIEQSTKIRDKDQRVFLDGIYVFERTEGM